VVVDLELYTSPTCRGCVEAKLIVEELKRNHPTINLKVIDISQEDGAETAFKKRILTLPTFIIHDQEGELRITGNNKEKLRDYFNTTDREIKGDGPRFLKIGAGLGLYNILMSLVFGIVCPSCVILAIGAFIYGFYKEYSERIKGSR